MSCARSSCAKAPEAFEDLVGRSGPLERLGLLIAPVDPLVDVAFEGGDARVDAAPELLGRQLRKDPFDEIEPGGAGGREVQKEARSLGQPAVDQGRLVSSVVVQDEVDVDIGGNATFDLVEEASELHTTVPAVATPGYLPGGNVESGEQGGRAVAGVVVRTPFHLPGSHRQKRLLPVESLDLRLLVDTQDDGVLRWVQVETDDIAHFLDEERVGRDLERLDPMRLEREGLPDAANRSRRHADPLSHRSAAPVAGVAGHGLQGMADHFLDLLIADRSGRSRPWLVAQPLQSPLYEPAPPLADRVHRNSEALANLGVRRTRSALQHSPGSGLIFWI